MKIGDMVKMNFDFRHLAYDKIRIIDIYSTISPKSSYQRRYKIEYIGLIDIRTGLTVKRWMNDSDITLDVEYYRDKKIEEILK